MASPEEFSGELVQLETHDGCMARHVMETSRRQCLLLAARLAFQQNGVELNALNEKISEINELPCGYAGSLCPRILPVQTLLVNAVVGGVGPSGSALEL